MVRLKVTPKQRGAAPLIVLGLTHEEVVGLLGGHRPLVVQPADIGTGFGILLLAGPDDETIRRGMHTSAAQASVEELPTQRERALGRDLSDLLANVRRAVATSRRAQG